jgi:hypothetical protein
MHLSGKLEVLLVSIQNVILLIEDSFLLTKILLKLASEGDRINVSQCRVSDQSRFAY